MILGLSFYLNTQTVERLINASEFNDLNYDYEVDHWESIPNSTQLNINEKDDEILITAPSLMKRYVIKNKVFTEKTYNYYDYTSFYCVENYIFSFDNKFISIETLNHKRVVRVEY